jgi:hypothetical protein
MEEDYSKYRSRKWILATASLGIVTVLAFMALVSYVLSDSFNAAGCAAIIGAWGGSDTFILGLYSHYNVEEGKG